MHVAHLSLADFRSYPTVELSLDPGVTALVGPNGQGKTNLVEAIGYVATLGSHRVSNDAPLVRFGAERAVVRAQVVRDGRPTLVEIEVTPGRANRARVNRGPVPRAREVLGLLRTVLFAPEDLALVKGDPGERRRFLDDLLVARAPRFAGVRSDYERVLKQRSALLKSAGSAIRRGQGDVRTLDVWDQHLATAGAELLAARLRLVRDLRPHVATAYEAVSQGQGAAEIGYRSSLADDLLAEVADAAGGGRELLQARLLEATSRMRSAELERGVCLVGPHRDDLLLQLGPFPAKGYASHGESWSYALALRLASYELLRHEGGGDPVLVLDDVFAELDVGRRERLAELVAGAEQVLVTAAVPQDVPEALEGARVDVMAGEVTRVR
ncbi:DNA replication/repair protein RecF [Angustibacter aerolatus]